jgi:hypothetical protein
MPSCTHDYSPSNQYFVTSAPGAKTRRSGRLLSAAEREDAGTAGWNAWEAEYDEREEEMFRARHGLYNTSKYKHISEQEEEEKEADKLRRDLKKQFAKIWLAFEQSKHLLQKEKDLMDRLKQDVQKLYEKDGDREFKENQAAARVLEKTIPVVSKKNEEDPFAMSPASGHRR